MTQEKNVRTRVVARAGSAVRRELTPLPDLCNFGLVLRTLFLTIVVCALWALQDAQTLASWPASFLKMIGIAAPTTLIWIVAMCSLRERLRNEPSWARYVGAGLVAVLPALLLLTIAAGLRSAENPLSFMQIIVWSGACGVWGVAAWHYFELRARAFSPALANAKLQALQSRIRPHFLFNSLNTAASLVRSDPVRAERLLEDLSDVFRAALREGTVLVPLQQEILLAQQYAAIEQLRLGERLIIEWKIGVLPHSARVPALLLQPLLENAIHHGIEPVTKPGDLQVRISCFGRELRIEVENSYLPQASDSGSGIALDNIRERLALLYDLEAQMRAGGDGQRFRVYIKLPVQPVSPLGR